MFVPATSVGIHVEGGGISDVRSGVIRNDGDVIAYLLITRITCLRIESGAHSDVRRPARTTIGAPGVKQLGIDVIRSIASVIPDNINACIGRH